MGIYRASSSEPPWRGLIRFGIVWQKTLPYHMLPEKLNLSDPKPEHTTGGSGRRGARRGGGARRGRAEQNADRSGGPEANRPSSPPGYRGFGNPSNFRPIRIDWVVNRPGWAPTPENLLSAAAAFGETPYAA